MGFKAHVVTEDSASGAQIIDGSVKVDDGANYDLHKLTRTATSGNRRTYTWAGWVKRQQLADKQTFMFAESDDSNQTSFGFNHSGATPASGFYFRTEISGTVTNATLDAVLRDTTNFYHIVVAVDTTRSYQAERIRVYINGKLQTWSVNPGMGEDNETFINHNVQQQLFAQDGAPDLDALVSNLYFLDGLALGPGYFGFTDPLTNTWRPKKFRAEGTTVNDGTQWSATIGDFTNGANVFNGNVTNQGYANNTGVTTLTTGKFIIKNNLRMLHNFREDGTYNLLINGVSINVPGDGTSSSTYRWADVDLSSLQLPITVTSLQYYISQVSGNSIRAIEVDGVIMQDSTTTNIDFGTNGFYLPFDGSSPIGEDKSGKGNDWTAIQLGSAGLDKATGAFPILNTVNGGKIATPITRTDANSSSIVLALPLCGNFNDVHADVKGSGSNVAITESGTVDFQPNQSNFYGRSGKFDGSNDKLTSGTVAVNQADFTVEAWVYFLNADSGNETVVEFTGTNRWIFGRKGTGSSSVMYIYDGSGERESTTTVVDDVWHHMAWVKDGGTVHYYLDGVKIHSYNGSYGTTSSNKICVGRNNDNYEPLHGYIQDVRVYNSAKYTKNFIPAAASDPDIVPDTPSGVSGGSKFAKYPPLTVDGGSTFFGQRTSKLTNVGDFAGISGTGDYTVSFWFYADQFLSNDNNGADGGFLYILNQGNSHPTYPIKIDISKNGKVVVADSANFGSSWYSTFNDASSYDTDHDVIKGQWNYIHVYRESGTLKIYNNGGLQLSVSQSNSSPAGISTEFCTNTSNVIIKDLRITNTAITDATPPTSPLTAVSGTQLLICHGNGLTDISGNTNTLSTTGEVVDRNFNPFTSDINIVRGQESGYPTLDPNNKLSNAVLSNNNLSWTCDNSGAGTVLANVAVDAGKYYWEVTVNNGNRFHAGVHVGAGDTLTTYDAGAILDNNWAFRTDGAKVHDGSESSTNFFSVTGIGNVIQLAYDADGGNLWFGANGHWFEGDPSTLSGPSYTGVTHAAGISPMLNRRTNDNGATINFGQQPFKYDPPIGFSPINASSIRSATRPISNPKAYFNSLTYNAAGGQGGSRHIDAGLEADFIWIKNRNNVKWHILVNGIIGYNKFISSNSDMALSTEAHVTNVNKTGYTVNDIDSGTVNEPGLTYVAWNWKAGGHSSNYNIDGVGHATAAAAGLSCTADLQGASIGTKQGFSIIQYQATSGETVAHGLSQQPDFMMIKNYDSQNDWMIYHKYGNGSGGDMSSSQGMNLNNTDGTFTSGSNTFITAKSATTFTVGSSAIVQNGSDDFCAFVWHDVPGLQKFGYYKGTGSSDGPVIKLGFRPALLIVKRTDADGEPWTMYDNVRGGDFKNPNTYNANAKGLYANSNAQENDASGRYKDFTNDGFKVRGTSGEQNSTGGFYIYMAWAEAPAFNLYGASAPAR